MYRELIHRVTINDCEVQSFRSGGNGGQHRDKTSNAVRIVHTASGAVGKSEESRSWTENRKIAFRRMAESEKFQTWLRRQIPAPTYEPEPDHFYTYKLPFIDLEHRKERIKK